MAKLPDRVLFDDMIHAAIGVVMNATHQILIAQRCSSYWEFPGGKLESGETAYAALCRELKEEVALDVIAATPLIKMPYDYGQYKVLLDAWLVNEYSGDACGAEGQNIRWVTFSELNQIKMLPANDSILEKLKVRLSR